MWLVRMFFQLIFPFNPNWFDEGVNVDGGSFMKKVIRFLRDKYTDKLNIAIITFILCLTVFPIITGWLVGNMGKLLSAIYLVVLIILFSIHGLFILCTLLPLWRDKLDDYLYIE